MSDELQERVVNKRFRLVYEELCEQDRIRNKSDIAQQLGTYNHVINDVMKHKRNLTLEQINKLIEIFDINPSFLFGQSDEMFLNEAFNEASSYELPSVPLAQKILDGRNNITLVPQRAMAGYALQRQDPSFLKDAPRFALPGLEGQLIAFEIDGDSMLPNITNGDVVVCEPLERGEPIKENAVYVVVTDAVAAKRVQLVKEKGETTALRLISDNSATYLPYSVDIDEVQQILKVKCRITNYGIA